MPRKKRSPRNDDPFARSNHREPWEPRAIHPIMFLELSAGDAGWEEGYRWRVDQLDEDQHFFADRERAEDFIILHGMKVVTVERMIDLREQAKTR